MLVLVSLSAPLAVAGEPVEVSTDQNWCIVANEAEPGTVVELLPGDHRDSCHLRVAGSEDAPVIIRSSDADDPARLSYSGTGANTVEIRAEARHLVIENLIFPGTAGPHAVRFHGAEEITLRGNHFERTGGVTLSANFSGEHARGLRILDNTIFDVETTAIYFGCHSGGDDCTATDIEIVGNTIYGVESPGVGYGIQIKVDSNAEVRDNAIFDTKGPGIMVYGAHGDGATPSIIDGNLVMGSRTSGAILVGGGPAVVTNNIVSGGHTYGIHAYQHNAGAPLKGVVIAHNTLFANGGDAIHAPGWSDEAGNTLVNNAIAPGEHQAIGGDPQGLVENNIVCDDPQACFFAIEQSPLSATPVAEGLLDEAAPAYEAQWYPELDFMGAPRSDLNFAGALNTADEAGEPWLVFGQNRPPRDDSLPEDPNDQQPIEDPAEEEPENEEPENEDDPDDEEDEPTHEEADQSDVSNGCSCSTAGTTPPALLLSLLLLVYPLFRRMTKGLQPATKLR